MKKETHSFITFSQSYGKADDFFNGLEVNNT